MSTDISNTGTLKNFISNAKDNTEEFLSSNSLVAKLAFIILVFFGFIILLRLGINFIAWLKGGVYSHKLIDGMVDAKQLIVIPQDPSQKDSNTINRSINEDKGIEFTWSVWIFIDDLNYNVGKYKCVFYKGNDDISETGLNFPNNAPGLYIAPNTNNLVVIMNTFNVINEEIVINDIPLNKWVNVIIRCENKDLDVYINGTIAKSHKLHGVPKQNYGNVYVAMNGGFSGYISDLAYYDYALGISSIQSVVVKGANTKLKGGTASLDLTNPNYLSLRWYFSGTKDAYNP